MENGLLFRWKHHTVDEDPTKQLVLQKSYWNMALWTAHMIPMAGHLGRKKTQDKLLCHFFWPGLYSDMAELCKSCPECQRAARHKKHQALLIPLPVTDQPFARVGIDLVGPLPRTKAEQRFILTMVDYATRYPEAIPLKRTDSETIAGELMTIFSHVGVLK